MRITLPVSRDNYLVENISATHHLLFYEVDNLDATLLESKKISAPVLTAFINLTRNANAEVLLTHRLKINDANRLTNAGILVLQGAPIPFNILKDAAKLPAVIMELELTAVSLKDVSVLKTPKTITRTIPPFGKLTIQNAKYPDAWRGEIELKAWIVASTGETDPPKDASVKRAVPLKISTPSAYPPGPVAPSEEQRDAFIQLKKTQKILASDILKTILRRMDETLEDVDDSDRPVPDLPQLLTPGDVKNNTRLKFIRIHDFAMDHLAFVGFVFSCNWNRNGLGVLTHAGKIAAIGESEVANANVWAEHCGGKQITV